MNSERNSDTWGPLALLCALVAAIVVLAAFLIPAIAHADGGPPAAPATASFDWQVWIALALGAIAGLKVVTEGIAMILRPIAPLTKNTVDDKVLAFDEKVHDKLDELLRLAKPIAESPQNTRGPQAGRSNIATMLSVAVVLAFAALLACTAAQRTATPGALIDCTAARGPAIGETVASMRGDCMADGKTDWTCVGLRAATTTAAIGGCAFLEVLSTPSKARVATAAAAGPDPDGAAVFERYRADHAGGATFHTAAGDR